MKMFRDELRANGVYPPIKQPIYSSFDHAYNARLASIGYNRRWMVDRGQASSARTAS
jgi:hypothetical protein